jgi:hypothetical protein
MVHLSIALIAQRRRRVLSLPPLDPLSVLQQVAQPDRPPHLQVLIWQP